MTLADDPRAKEAPYSTTQQERLRVSIFTTDALPPAQRVFYERLAADPLIDFKAIIVDEYRRAPDPLPRRVLAEYRVHGIRWLASRLAAKAQNVLRAFAACCFDKLHPPIQRSLDLDTLGKQIGVDVIRIPDMNDPEYLPRIEETNPQLGVIFGGRILKPHVLAIPELGMLNIHKRKVPEYRGGGAIGYWELLADEKEIGVTIHYATAQVDAGPVLAQTVIPLEEFETLASIRIKTDIVGVNLYLETIHEFARGNRQGRPQESSTKRPFRSAGEYAESLLERELKRRAKKAMPSVDGRFVWISRLRVFVQYLLVLPFLIHKRNRLIRENKAPIWILYYHLIANRPLNHMVLQLEQFASEVEFIQRYYPIISLDQVVQRLSAGHNEQIAVALTFDDGYRDNLWAVEYLRFYQVPACFFVCAGHIRDETCFEHDLVLGYEKARPWSRDEVKLAACDMITIGSHGLYHEDFGKIEAEHTQRCLRESKAILGDILGKPPEHFSFPFGLRGIHINEENYRIACQQFDYVYSAYGGYNYPDGRPKHLQRFSNPCDFFELLFMIDGYRGLGGMLRGDAWGLHSHKEPPY